MFYGSKSRRSTAGVGHHPAEPVHSTGEAVNLYLNKSIIAKCPADIQGCLQAAREGHRKCGVCGPFAWAATDAAGGNRIVWWKFRKDKGFTTTSSSGEVPLLGISDLQALRSVVFYEAGSDIGEAGLMPSVAVADSHTLSIFRIRDGSCLQADSKTWSEIGVTVGTGTLLCALQQDGYLVGCGSPGALFAIRDDGNDSPLENGADVFEDGTLYQRLWGVTRKWLQGADAPNHAEVKAIVTCKAQSGVGRGVGEVEVLVLTESEVHKWRLATGAEVAASLVVSRHKSALGSNAQCLCGIQVERVCAGNGRLGDSCVQVLAMHAASSFKIHYLSLSDLQVARPEQAVPAFSPSPAQQVALLPPTAPQQPGACANVHVSDGMQIYSARASAADTDDAAEAERDWERGPEGAVVGAEAMAEDRKRGAEVVVLTTAAVLLLHPALHDSSLHRVAAVSDGGLLRALTSDKSPSNVLQAFKRTDIAQQVTAGQTEHDFDTVALLVEAVRFAVVDRTFELGPQAPEKRIFEKFLAEKERQFKVYQSAMAAVFSRSDFPSLHECLSRYLYRIQATHRLLDTPFLFPQASLLSDAIELTVATPAWDGENALRPWAVAWRVFCERCSRCEDVLAGVVKRLEQLEGEGLAHGREDAVVQSFLEGVNVFHSVFCGVGDADLATQAPPAIQHVINHRSMLSLGTAVSLTFGVCAALRHQSGRGSAMLEEALVRLQGLHVGMLHKGPHAGMDALWCSAEIKARCKEYVGAWGAEGLNQLDKRIHLAESFGDIDVLVSISVEDFAGDRAEQERRNDQWAQQFRHLSYATHLLDRLRREDVMHLWDPPFRAYDFTAELSAYVGAEDNLCWVNALRAIEHNARLGRREGPLGMEQRFNYVSEQTLAMSQRAPDVHSARTLTALAKLSAEAAARNAGTPTARPGAAFISAGMHNTRVQIAERISGGALWSIDRAAKECVEMADDKTLPQSKRRKLLREAMLLLGHWHNGGAEAGAAEPSQEWKRVFQDVVARAGEVEDKHAVDDDELMEDSPIQYDVSSSRSFGRRLVIEALNGAGEVRIGRQSEWPHDTVQYRFLSKQAT